MDASLLPLTDQADGLIHAAAESTRDLNTPRPWIYWADLLASAALGYTALGLAITAGPVAIKLVSGLVASLALYRAISFIHELTHLKPGGVPGFRFAWNLLVGVPLLLPSFLYEGVHTLHHARTRYGTARDPEYLPLARLHPATLALFLLAAVFAPLALVLRFAILAPLSVLVPRWRKLVVEQCSALTIAPSFCRKPPESRDWRWWEAAASLWAITLIVLTVVGYIPWQALVIFLAVASGAAVLNQLRTLVAHLWENDGAPISITAQYLDSVNVPSGLLAALWAPVGLRYHALHHLLPGIPYHALGEAHRRLAARLPPQSPFHGANHKSLHGLVVRLVKSARRA